MIPLASMTSYVGQAWLFHAVGFEWVKQTRTNSRFLVKASGLHPSVAASLAPGKLEV